MIQKRNLIYLGLLLGALTLGTGKSLYAVENNIFQDEDEGDVVADEDAGDSIVEKMLHFLGRKKCAADDVTRANSLENRISTCTAIYRDKTDAKAKRDSGVSFSTYQSCIHDTTEDFTHITDVTCKARYIKPVLKTQMGMIYNRINTLRPENSPLNLNANDLQELFKLTNTWLTDVRVTFQDGSQSVDYQKMLKKSLKVESEEYLAKKIDLIVRAFLSQTVKLTKEHPEYLLQDRAFLVGLDSSAQILEAALAEQLNPQVLFPIIAQLLIPIHQRLDLMVDIHDFQCELKNCTGNHAEHNELSRTIEALAGLDVVTKPRPPVSPKPVQELGKQSSKKTISKKPTPESNSVGKGGKANEELTVQNKILHRFLTALFGVKKIFGEAETLLYSQLPKQILTTKAKWAISNIPEGNFPIYFQEYSSLVTTFSEWFTNYRFTGYFKKRKMSDLDFGLTPENITTVKAQMSLMLDRLNNGLTKYEGVSRDNHELLKSQINLTSEMEQLDDLDEDLKSGQANLRDKEDRFSRYSQSAFKLLNSSTWQGSEGSALLTQSDHRFSVSGTDAHYDDEMSKLKKDKIQDIAIYQNQFTSTSSEEGDIVNLEVNGKWSPTCALRQSQFAKRKNGQTSTVLIGPEGFTQTDSSSDSQVESSNNYRSHRGFHSDSHTDSDTSTKSASLSLEVSVGTPKPLEFLGFGVKASATATTSRTGSHSFSDSRGSEDSWGKNDSNTSSDEKRRSASFELGLRLSHTPFPDMPAGSLLLVQMKRGLSEMKDIVDVQVVRGYSTHVIKQPVDLYLVANDCRSESTEKLSVHLTVQRPLSHEVKKVSTAMLDSAKIISEEGAKYLRAGAMTGVQMESLRRNAQKSIVLEGMDAHKMGLLHQLYEGWIAEELAQLEGKIRILSSERQLRVINHRAQDLEEDIRYLKAKQNVGSLAQLSSYDNRDIFYLGEQLNHSIQFFRHRLLPVIRLRHPSVINHLLTSQRSKFEELTSFLSVDQSMKAIAEKFIPIYSAVQQFST